MIVTCLLQYNVKSTLYVMNEVKKVKILTELNNKNITNELSNVS